MHAAAAITIDLWPIQECHMITYFPWGIQLAAATSESLSYDFRHCALSTVSVCAHVCVYIIWLYFMLKIFRTLLFRVVLISHAPHIVYETRVKMSLLNNIRSFNFRTDGSVREYEIKPNYGSCACVHSCVCVCVHVYVMCVCEVHVCECVYVECMYRTAALLCPGAWPRCWWDPTQHIKCTTL